MVRSWYNSARAKRAGRVVVCPLRQPLPVMIGFFLKFPVSTVWGRTKRQQRFNLRTYLSGVDVYPVYCNGQNVVMKLPHVFGKFLEVRIVVVDGTIEDGLVKPLQPGGYEGCDGRMADGGWVD